VNVLSDTYKSVKPGVVSFMLNAVVHRVGEALPPFPHIFGTGFVVDANGLVVTNRHVCELFGSTVGKLKKINKVPRCLVWAG